jgi:hypothetical protein
MSSANDSELGLISVVGSTRSKIQIVATVQQDHFVLASRKRTE